TTRKLNTKTHHKTNTIIHQAPEYKAHLPAVNSHPEQRLLALLLFHFVAFFRFGRVVAAPQPSQLFGQLGASMRSIVRAARETEVEIVAAHLERIRHLDILQRPAPVIVLQILGAILEPDPYIAFGLFSNQEWKIVASQN